MLVRAWAWGGDTARRCLGVWSQQDRRLCRLVMSSTPGRIHREGRQKWRPRNELPSGGAGLRRGCVASVLFRSRGGTSGPDQSTGQTEITSHKRNNLYTEFIRGNTATLSFLSLFPPPWSNSNDVSLLKRAMPMSNLKNSSPEVSEIDYNLQLPLYWHSWLRLFQTAVEFLTDVFSRRATFSNFNCLWEWQQLLQQYQ